MNPKKPTYKQVHGTSKIGDFLRSIGKSDLLNKVLTVSGELITGDVKGAVEQLLKGSDELTQDQRDYALKLLESDLKENEEVTKRWSYDSGSDSFLAKNVRPMMLIYLTFMMTLIAVLDSANISFEVNQAWITLLESLLITSYVAYFGGRSFEKSKRL